MNKAGAQSVDDDEDIQINDITFQHFIDVTFQTQAKCLSTNMFSITTYFLVSTLIFIFSWIQGRLQDTVEEERIVAYAVNERNVATSSFFKNKYSES